MPEEKLSLPIPEKRKTAPLTARQVDTAFADIKPAFTVDEALAESARCLFCYDAPCIQACPTEIDVPSFIRKILTRNWKGSARVIYEANTFGATCARVCPVEVLCEGACVLNDLHEKPIDIGRLQRFSTDWAAEKGIEFFQPGAPNGKKVAVIGAGPAGLSCAADLRGLGYEVTVVERRAHAGGLNVYGCAPYKITWEDGQREVETVRKLGVQILTNVEVGKDIPLEDLEKSFDAIFLGVGLGGSPNLGIPGEDLPGVVGAVEFIASLRAHPTKTQAGRRVVVVGGGNTSIDAATEAKRLGAQTVTLLYRREEGEMPAYAFEKELALRDQVHFLFEALAVRILGKRFAEGIECVRTQIAPKGKGQTVRKVPRSRFILPADMIVKAIGQAKPADFLMKIPGLHFTREGFIEVNDETLQTGNSKYFAGGDCIGKGLEVVYAVAHGKRAAQGIHRTVSAQRMGQDKRTRAALKTV